MRFLRSLGQQTHVPACVCRHIDMGWWSAGWHCLGASLSGMALVWLQARAHVINVAADTTAALVLLVLHPPSPVAPGERPALSAMRASRRDLVAAQRTWSGRDPHCNLRSNATYEEATCPKRSVLLMTERPGRQALKPAGTVNERQLHVPMHASRAAASASRVFSRCDCLRPHWQAREQVFLSLLHQLCSGGFFVCETRPSAHS